MDPSNAAPGFIDAAEVRRASTDRMALKTASFDFVRQIVLGQTDAEPEARLDALRHLEALKADRAAVERVLEQASNDPDRNLAEAATHELESLRRRPAN